jgi:hypothetical protein
MDAYHKEKVRARLEEARENMNKIQQASHELSDTTAGSLAASKNSLESLPASLCSSRPGEPSSELNEDPHKQNHNDDHGSLPSFATRKSASSIEHHDARMLSVIMSRLDNLSEIVNGMCVAFQTALSSLHEYRDSESSGLGTVVPLPAKYVGSPVSAKGDGSHGNHRLAGEDAVLKFRRELDEMASRLSASQSATDAVADNLKKLQYEFGELRVGMEPIQADVADIGRLLRRLLSDGLLKSPTSSIRPALQRLPSVSDLKIAQSVESESRPSSVASPLSTLRGVPARGNPTLLPTLLKTATPSPQGGSLAAPVRLASAPALKPPQGGSLTAAPVRVASTSAVSPLACGGSGGLWSSEKHGARSQTPTAVLRLGDAPGAW